jgi:hypothetical protein
LFGGGLALLLRVDFGGVDFFGVYLLAYAISECIVIVVCPWNTQSTVTKVTEVWMPGVSFPAESEE